MHASAVQQQSEQGSGRTGAGKARAQCTHSQVPLKGHKSPQTPPQDTIILMVLKLLLGHP